MNDKRETKSPRAKNRGKKLLIIKHLLTAYISRPQASFTFIAFISCLNSVNKKTREHEQEREMNGLIYKLNY